MKRELKEILLSMSLLNFVIISRTQETQRKDINLAIKSLFLGLSGLGTSAGAGVGYGYFECR
jgi:hypothetical protein